MIIIAYGANLPGRFGQPLEAYQVAKDALIRHKIAILAESSLWETSPVGTPDEQPWYTNAVLSVDTALPAQALMEALLAIEHEFGRVRSFKNAAKPIDLDLIAYHDQVIGDAPNLIVPHPRMQERAFVLKPLEEIAKNWTHPVSGISLNDMIKKLPADQEARIMERGRAA
jgi:2-amino-4-hydroxy-6-hydroxymethyldihydropteridine diphosphokinase